MGKTQKNEFQISGKVLFAGMPENITPTFNKRLVVLEEYDGQYRQEVPYEFLNDNMGLVNGVNVNDWVNIDFISRGRKKIDKDGMPKWWPSNEGKAIVVDNS